MSSLELQLIEMGATLDAPDGDKLVDRVAEEIAEEPAVVRRGRRRAVALMAAAAISTTRKS